MGTYILSGYGTALVVATGTDTELGKISKGLESHNPETAFERGIRHFGQLLIKIVVLIAVVVFAIKVGIQHKPLADALMVSLAHAVGMTPQLLPAVTSVVLAAGANAMAKKQVIIKQLLSIGTWLDSATLNQPNGVSRGCCAENCANAKTANGFENVTNH